MTPSPTPSAAAPLPGTPPRDAIPALVDAYGDRVYRLGLRICPTSTEAEDLVQETMVAALKSWPRFKGDSHPYTWLFRIAMRTCRRMHRKRVGEPDHLIPLDELLGLSQGSALRSSGNNDAMSSEPDASQRRTLQDEVRRRLDAALERVPTVFRVALVLKDIADFSLEEIAEILEIQAATAKTRVHRGRLHLRRALDEEGIFTPLPSSDVPRQVCLDLLRAKLDAMDRGVEFPLPHAEICDRCSALFRSMDLAQEACASLRSGRMPARLRERLRALAREA
ncbi:MAG: sigma-70 family RNA polymerase sigma factor [Gemmatimonadales bacterium]|nr:MAG: sigma-70 family RNA polymerase sigma factor [Gemmatimonadales bacterium]